MTVGATSEYKQQGELEMDTLQPVMGAQCVRKTKRVESPCEVWVTLHPHTHTAQHSSQVDGQKV